MLLYGDSSTLWYAQRLTRFYDNNMLPPIEYLEDSDRERIVGNDIKKTSKSATTLTDSINRELIAALVWGELKGIK
jgi:hypothetical protein